MNIVGLPVEADINTDVMMCLGDIAQAVLRLMRQAGYRNSNTVCTS